MKDTVTEVAITTATAYKTTVFGSSALLSNMVIFNDIGYIIIGIIGCIASMMSESYDYTRAKRIKEKNGEECIRNYLSSISMAFVIGILFTLASFMILNIIGEQIISYVTGMDLVVKLTPSIWMILTLIMATKAVKIYSKYLTKELDDDK
ncbi:MAG: hypothetical protein HKP62_06570 [Sulfurovum sp.]|nr:hypothetical protein [Sulfurovum sp.]NNJ45660.1 hypothetical protein [Sulfurovum sp.]